jgi:hypothetical protein
VPKASKIIRREGKGKSCRESRRESSISRQSAVLTMGIHGALMDDELLMEFI